MEWDWSEILYWDWKEIDALIYQGEQLRACRGIRENYKAMYGRYFGISDSHGVMLERLDFLHRYHPDSFAEPIDPMPRDYESISIDTEKYKVIRLYAEWNAWRGTEWELETDSNCLVVFAECMKNETSEEGTANVSVRYLFMEMQSQATKFDSDYQSETFEEIINEVEPAVRSMALKLGVPYSIQPQPRE